MSITLVLPYPISANRYWATRVIARPKKPPHKPLAMTYVTPEAVDYKSEVSKLALEAGIRAPITGRVRITLRLFPSRPQDWARRARKDPDGWDDTVQCLDLDNARKVVYDALKGVAIEDDKWVRQDAAERCEPDELGARVEVTIEPMQVAPIAPQLFHEEPAAPPVATDIACAPAREEAA
ncbi:RusA family crossover junction endodeoxyribonuclease [Lysobacter sp. Root667]|uniref:RusA family crossover junction endodeoxyribonuclease n=1 Tax=Lysobacter sp. Root667 TaxID=1736581 RepID=UPI0009EB7FAF|nr:RusA family crossover junction endodeoxyribonuclease [Lysobacter sp. Root667]